MNITEKLFLYADEQYASFQCRLIPGLSDDSVIGVRVPELRIIASEYITDDECPIFLSNLPHRYYDENILHGLLISKIRDYEKCLSYLDRFLPFVDNWAVCDTMSPFVFRKHKAELIDKIGQWTASDHVFTCRFGIGMLMKHFLDEDFRPEYLKIPSEIRSREYYVNMMIAWYFATALAKQWDSAIPYLENGDLSDTVVNMTVSKCRDSYRISEEQKKYLRTFRKPSGK